VLTAPCAAPPRWVSAPALSAPSGLDSWQNQQNAPGIDAWNDTDNDDDNISDADDGFDDDPWTY
jgi:hypothetical protein